MKAAATFTVLALVCFAIGINGEDIGLPAVVTGKRIGLALLTAAILWIPLNRVKIPRASRVPAWVLAVIGLWGIVSLLFSGGGLISGMGSVTAWLLTAYGSLAFSLVFSWIIPGQKSRFINLMAIAGALAPIMTVALLTVNYGPDIFFRFMPLRFALDSLASGMSRFMNGLFFLSVIPIAVILGVFRCRRPVYIISLIGMGVFVSFSLISGSRQTVGAISLYLLSLLVFGTLFD
ncbi:MAG: hypothetical protein U9N73_09845, partial [Candidatus Auribacterota bacterium]|nr:hypothetical protein [Candidatus Auribacterota bacterium]